MNQYKFCANDGDIAIAYVQEEGKPNDIIYLNKGNGFPHIDLARNPKRKRSIMPCLPVEDDQVIRFFISGVQGVGKSWLANEIIKDRLDYCPDKKIFVFSPFDEDPSLDRDLEDRIERPEPWNYETEEFANSIVVFDDIDSFSKEPIVTAMYKLVKTLLQAGRKQGTDVIYIGHTLKNGQRTKYVIQESNYIVVFPNAGNDPQISAFLRDYCGLSKNAIKKILSIRDSRWAIIHKAFPVYVLTQQSIYFPE